ncbi:hypothetical protein A7K93_05095, partial [Candidatus Methylacidiphilum fumarolicum]
AKIASSPLEHLQNQPIFTKHGLGTRAFVLVINRLICPGSDHANAQWQETGHTSKAPKKTTRL